MRLFVGSRLPAYASSLGRAMLAFLPEDEVDEILGMRRLTKLTENTITNRRELFEELRLIHDRGYAVNDQQLSSVCAGSPLRSSASRDAPSPP